MCVDASLSDFPHFDLITNRPTTVLLVAVVLHSSSLRDDEVSSFHRFVSFCASPGCVCVLRLCVTPN